jgi:asparagine synthase (glutamine-hydrolysing)
VAGITGIIGRDVAKEATPATLATMVDCLDHELRRTRTIGTFDGGRSSACVAWAKRDYEPPCVAWNSSRSIGLVFVGEDFDADAKAASLRASGERPESDAECFLRLYEISGVDFISTLNGRFAGVIFDCRTDTVHLFNDRFGLNRIFVHESDGELYFSTEAKSLLAVLPATRRIDQRGLAEFFSVGCVMQDRTVFRDINLLPPGSCWTFERGRSARKAFYFDRRSWEEQEPLSADEYGRQLIEVFSRVAPKYLRGVAPVGMSLTGGLDSRMILAWIHAKPGTLPCYTFGGPYRDCADVRIARRLAHVSSQPHTTIPIGSDFFEEFSDLAARAVYATDGSMDVSGAVELYANRRARMHAPIRLTGNYGSEILRANVAFRPGRVDRSLFTPEFGSLLDQASATYSSEANCRRLSFIAFKQVPWHHYARFAAEYSQLTPRSPFLDHELVKLAYRAPRELEGSPLPLLNLITRGNPALDTVPTDRALRANVTPFVGKLKREWHEFTAKAEYAYDYGMPQWLARADGIVKPLHLERLFLGRHKFYHFRIWYRDQLSRMLQEGEFSRPLPCYRNGIPAQLIRQHTSGKYNWTLELHKLLTVHLIERQFTGTSCRI